MAQLIWNCAAPLEEIIEISVWTMGWLVLATIIASWNKLRIHLRAKFFMQKIKASINCALNLAQAMGTEWQFSCRCSINFLCNMAM
jgi:hypothetical protein